MVNGVANFFRLCQPLAGLQPTGALEATNFYETSELKSTLERLVDFDRINEGTTRLSVGAVNVRSGNFVYFDTTTHSIRPGHVSSGKLAVDHAFQANRAISSKSSRGLRGNNLAGSP
jgi:NTE family protein